MSDERTEDHPAPEDAPAANLPATQPRRKAELVANEDSGYIVPRTMEEAYRYAVAVVDARLAPDSYNNNPSAVMLGIAAAMEAGLPPLYGLRNIAIINGRPTIWGDAGIALVQKAGLLVDQKVQEIGPEFDRSFELADWPPDFGILVRLWRKGQENPYEGKFTVADAKRANLWLNLRKKPWMEHPVRMLTARARTWALRDGFADCLAGLAIREEVEDYTSDKVEAANTAFLDDDDAPAETAEVAE